MKNVIVIMCDSLQFNYLGCYGNDWIKTPNFDRLAKESVVFDNAYAEGLPTVPVRRALLTGRYTLPFKGWAPLDPDDTTIADILWHNSIQTALITDTAPMHLPKYGYERGFDQTVFFRGQEFDHYYYDDPLTHLDPDDYHKPKMMKGEDGTEHEEVFSIFAKEELYDYLPPRQHWKDGNDQMVGKVSSKAIEYLENVDKTKPFLLWLDSFDPHEPWDPPSTYDPDLKCPYDPDYDGKPLINPLPGFVNDLYTEKELHHVRMLYAEKVTNVDKQIGRVLDRVRELGLMENTLIVFLADHGEPLGNNEHGHGIMRKCRPWPYEELAHIPLMVKVPGVEGGTRHGSFVQTPDIAPTIMDWLGITERTEQMQGESLMPLIKGEKEKIRDFAIAGYYNFSWSIIRDDYSYIHWLRQAKLDEDENHSQTMIEFYDQNKGQRKKILQLESDDSVWTCTPGSEAEMPEGDELYERESDQFQLKNLAEEKPELGKELLDQLREFMTDLRAS
jgi:arylsulfatase A-like enzyme